MDRACSEGGGKRGLGPHNSTTQVNPFKIFPKLQRVVGRGLEPPNSTTHLNPFKIIPELYPRLAQRWPGLAQRVVGTQACPGVATSCSEGGREGAGAT